MLWREKNPISQDKKSSFRRPLLVTNGILAGTFALTAPGLLGHFVTNDGGKSTSLQAGTGSPGISRHLDNSSHFKNAIDFDAGTIKIYPTVVTTPLVSESAGVVENLPAVNGNSVFSVAREKLQESGTPNPTEAQTRTEAAVIGGLTPTNEVPDLNKIRAGETVLKVPNPTKVAEIAQAVNGQGDPMVINAVHAVMSAPTLDDARQEASQVISALGMSVPFPDSQRTTENAVPTPPSPDDYAAAINNGWIDRPVLHAPNPTLWDSLENAGFDKATTNLLSHTDVGLSEIDPLLNQTYTFNERTMPYGAPFDNLNSTVASTLLEGIAHLNTEQMRALKTTLTDDAYQKVDSLYRLDHRAAGLSASEIKAGDHEAAGVIIEIAAHNDLNKLPETVQNLLKELNSKITSAEKAELLANSPAILQEIFAPPDRTSPTPETPQQIDTDRTNNKGTWAALGGVLFLLGITAGAGELLRRREKKKRESTFFSEPAPMQRELTQIEIDEIVDRLQKNAMTPEEVGLWRKNNPGVRPINAHVTQFPADMEGILQGLGFEEVEIHERMTNLLRATQNVKEKRAEIVLRIENITQHIDPDNDTRTNEYVTGVYIRKNSKKRRKLL